MHMETPRCILLPFSGDHTPEALRLFTDPAVREFLGGSYADRLGYEKSRSMGR